MIVLTLRLADQPTVIDETDAPTDSAAATSEMRFVSIGHMKGVPSGVCTVPFSVVCYVPCRFESCSYVVRSCVSEFTDHVCLTCLSIYDALFYCSASILVTL